MVETGGELVPRDPPTMTGAGQELRDSLSTNNRFLLRLPGVVEPESNDLPLGVVSHVLQPVSRLRDDLTHLPGGGVHPQGGLPLSTVLETIVEVPGARFLHHPGRLGQVLGEVSRELRRTLDPGNLTTPTRSRTADPHIAEARLPSESIDELPGNEPSSPDVKMSRPVLLELHHGDEVPKGLQLDEASPDNVPPTHQVPARSHGVPPAFVVTPRHRERPEVVESVYLHSRSDALGNGPPNPRSTIGTVQCPAVKRSESPSLLVSIEKVRASWVW